MERKLGLCVLLVCALNSGCGLLVSATRNVCAEVADATEEWAERMSERRAAALARQDRCVVQVVQDEPGRPDAAAWQPPPGPQTAAPTCLLPTPDVQVSRPVLFGPPVVLPEPELPPQQVEAGPPTGPLVGRTVKQAGTRSDLEATELPMSTEPVDEGVTIAIHPGIPGEGPNLGPAGAAESRPTGEWQ
jgi:hypothetical protein